MTCLHSLWALDNLKRFGAHFRSNLSPFFSQVFRFCCAITSFQLQTSFAFLAHQRNIRHIKLKWEMRCSKGSAFEKSCLIYSYSFVACWFQSRIRTPVVCNRQGSSHIVDSNAVVWHFFAGMRLSLVFIDQQKGYSVITKLQVICLTIHLIWNALSSQ